MGSNRYRHSDGLGFQGMPSSDPSGLRRVLSDDVTRSEVLKVIGARVEFFRARSNPADPFDRRESRDSYPLRDDYMNKDDYIFVWKKTKKGRLLLTLEECGLFTSEMRLESVRMRVDDGEFHQVEEFVADRNSRMQLEVMISLDASMFGPSRLEERSPYRGRVEEKYVALSVWLEVAMDTSGRSVSIPATVFCQVRENRKTRVLYCIQRCERWWEELPQSHRAVLKLAPRLAKFVLERLLRR